MSALRRTIVRRRLTSLTVPAAALLVLSGCSATDPESTTQPTATVTVEAYDPSEQGSSSSGRTGLRDGNCAGSVGDRRVSDDVEVPNGATCLLDGTRIDGDIEIEQGGILRANNIEVAGNIQGEGHREVVVRASEVGGDLQLEDGGGATVVGTQIGGNLQSEDNRAAQTFRNNTIDGDLECESNQPAPRGGGNQVSGDREDQCSGL